MTASDTIDRMPGLGVITGKWILIAGSIGIALQLAWCLFENFSDEQYFAHKFVISEVERLVEGTRLRDGQIETISDRSLAPYRGEDAAAYGFRILDAKARVLAQSNAALVDTVSPLTTTPSLWADAWQRKIGAGWFEVIGGVKRRVGEQDVWIEVMTLGDPQHYRLRALKAEIMLDVWSPLAPTLALTTLLGVVAVRRALRPLTIAARRAHSLDVQQGLSSFDIAGLPREAANFASAINRLMTRIEVLIRTQERLFARVAHDLRTRLAILLLELNRIKDDRARRLEDDVAEMSDTVNRLLTMARLEASNSTVQKPQTVDLNSIAKAVITQIAPLAELRSCQVSLRVDQPDSFLGDPSAVMEAIRNVTENAVKHGPDGNSVRIACGPGRVVTIDDSGPGLMADDVDRLFEPFERGTTTADGAGLGLTIVKVAVDIHRGSIEVGQSPSGGARFTLRFGSIASHDALSDGVAGTFHEQAADGMKRSGAEA